MSDHGTRQLSDRAPQILNVVTDQYQPKTYVPPLMTEYANYESAPTQVKSPEFNQASRGQDLDCVQTNPDAEQSRARYIEQNATYGRAQRAMSSEPRSNYTRDPIGNIF